MALKLALMGAGLALSGAQMFMQMQHANAAAAMQEQAAQLEYEHATRVAQENYRREIDEMYRQQERIDQAAKEKKSDLARKVDAEMAAMRVQLGEMGAMGTLSGMSLMTEQDYNFGVNISRIEGNRQEEIEAIQADKAAAGMDMANAVNRAGLNFAISSAEARMRAQQERGRAFLSFLDSGLQIGTQAFDMHQRQNLARNYPNYRSTRYF